MSVTATQQSYYTTNTTNTTRALNQELDRDAFLNLLIVQMQNQDPMKPMEDKEFIAQLAQFSSLEQMQQVSKTMELVAAGTVINNAAAFVGKTITAQGPDDAEPFTGKVDAIVFEEGVPMLQVGERKIALGWVTKVQ